MSLSAAARLLVSPSSGRFCRLSRLLHASSVLPRRKKHELKKLTYQKSSVPLVGLWRNMTVQQLANALQKSVDDVFEIMICACNTDVYDSPGSQIDNLSLLVKVARQSGVRSRIIAAPIKTGDSQKNEPVDKDVKPRPQPVDRSGLPRRPPVVTIMGHVDHGKTTMLDALRNSHVVDAEFGGITQHIGAFSVDLNGERVTFLDTPGHAAFAAMRQRGVLVTDLIVLVVAADDGVMEQTIQSIEYARQSNVPILVAINKCDRPNADIENAKKLLAVHGVQLEESGGDVISVEVSALKGHGLPQLVEAVLTQAALIDLRCEHTGEVEGFVLESCTDVSRGKVGTVLVKRGTIRNGVILVAGNSWARVRIMLDENSRRLTESPPGTAVQVVGWRQLPSAGDLVLEVESERRAQEVIAYRNTLLSEEKQKRDGEAWQQKLQQHLTEYRAQRQEKLDMGIRFFRRISGFRERRSIEDVKEGPALYIIIKGDVDGSVEAILNTLDTYHEPEVRLELVHYGVGPVTENDVKMAEPFNAIIYPFNVEIPHQVKVMADRHKVRVRSSKVIYRLFEDIKRELDVLTPPVTIDEILGEAAVLQEFMVTEQKTKRPVAGSRCETGILKKDGLFRLMRSGEVVYDGCLKSMRHLKNEVDSVKKGVECGLMLDSIDIRVLPGDTIQCYQRIEKSRTNQWNPGFLLMK